MKMKIKLAFFRTLFSQSAASLTMSRLASVIRDDLGLEVDLCLLEKGDLHNLDTLVEKNKDYNILIAKPNFKDFQVMFNYLACLKKIKIFDKIFLCGPFASLNSKSLLRANCWLDGVIKYPIEVNALQIIYKLSRDRGFRLKGERRLLRRALAGQAISFADLPRPARDIEKKEWGSYANLEFSWGCDYHCSFCHLPLLKKEGGAFAASRTPQSVIEEVAFLQHGLNKNFFIFNDSCFWRSAYDNDRITEFCRKIKQKKLKVHFYIYLRCRPFIGEDNIKKLSAAGLVRVFVGLESFSGRDQEAYDKVIEENNFIRIKKILDKYKINVHIGFIVFSPYSTLRDVAKNIRYLDSIGHLFRIGVILEPVRLIPGSNLQKKLAADGLLSNKSDYKDVSYGYIFKNKSTGRCLEFLKSTFGAEDLKSVVYEFEYFCTTMGLIYSLLMKDGERHFDMIKSDYYDFYTLKKQGEKVLKKYLLYVVGRFGSGRSVEPSETEAFREAFIRSSLLLKIKYSLIKSIIARSKDRSILSEVYSGRENL